MGHYRPRPSETRSCQHCANSYLSSHKRTRYCGESCRQLAYQARRKTRQPPALTDSAAGQLRLSLQNVGVTTAGSALVALTNYLVNDRPAQQVLLTQLSQLTRQIDQLNQALQSCGLQVTPDSAPISSPTAKSKLSTTEKPITLDDWLDEIVLKNSQRA